MFETFRASITNPQPQEEPPDKNEYVTPHYWQNAETSVTLTSSSSSTTQAVENSLKASWESVVDANEARPKPATSESIQVSRDSSEDTEAMMVDSLIQKVVFESWQQTTSESEKVSLRTDAASGLVPIPAECDKD